MDGQRFDDIARFLGASLNRKRFLTLVAGIVAPAGLATSGHNSLARNGKRRKRRGNGVSVQGGDNPVCAALCSGSVPNPQFCGGFGNCGSDEDCIAQDPNRPICCTTAPGCGGAGEGACCSEATCVGDCTTSEDCGESCACLDGSCAPFCPGNCDGDPEVCNEIPGGEDDCLCPNGACRCTDGVCRTCEGACTKDLDCEDLPGCVCIIEAGASSGACGTPDACPGLCQNNATCEDLGGDACVCFLGNDVNVAAAVQAEGVPPNGACGECLGIGVFCDASTECCGQLVCQNGACQRKRKPKDRCHKHGGSCHRDNDCCAQAVCYKGKCGEKDTHCHNDRECAQGYRCQGGPLAPNHRRCRKNGQRKRNRRNRKTE